MCLRPALAFLLLLGLVAGCVQEESVETQDIVSAIPWPDPERAGDGLVGAYDAEEGIVNITEISGDGEEQLVPLRLEEHYYENESSLFLWRTIDFEDGYKASYHSVLSNFRQNNLG